MLQEFEISNFTAGEFSPKLSGRDDLEKYFNACSVMVNMVTMPQGGATRRPGTRFVAYTKEQLHPCRPVRFVFSTVQAYILEFSDHAVRVYKDDGVVLNGGSPVDIAVPYAWDEVPELKFTQSADTLYIFHPDHPPATLTRSSHVNWTYALLAMRDGPYLDTNITSTTLTPSGATGSITITASSTTGINNNAGFVASDVGRLIRIKLYSLWAWVKITAVTDATHVTATVQEKVQFGAEGELDGAAWATNTAYVTGETVLCNGKYYRCRQAGTSAPSGTGPNGTGTQIVDGTCVWTLAGGFNALPWAFNTAYAVDATVNANGNSYQCIVAGQSSGAGSGPSGTGDNITDGTVHWRYLPPFQFPTATKDWRLGAWGEGPGYPACGRFWQGRLFMAAPRSQPNRIDGSQPGDFTNAGPTTADGTVTDGNALSWVLDDDEVNSIHWLKQAGSFQTMQLAMGTDAAEHILQAASASQALTPTSVQAYPETSYGSAGDVDPLRIGKAILFCDRPARKLREFTYFWQSNGYIAPDILQFSEHITRAPDKQDPAQSGFRWLAYQQSPFGIIWAGRNDGMLVGITYDREQTIVAPHRHRLGGDYFGGPPVVEYGAIIPSADGTYDELWLTVMRTVNGQVVRFMEVMTRFFDNDDQDEMFFLDAGLSSPLTYPAATLTPSGFEAHNPPDLLPQTMMPTFTGDGTFAASADVFTSASVGSIVRVNGGKAVVTGFTDARHITAHVLRAMLSLSPAADGEWSCSPRIATATGLNHLESENVVVLGDGAYFGEQAVTGGAVHLDFGGASRIHAGLPNSPILITMPASPKRAVAISSAGKAKRIDTLWVRFLETLGCTFGRRMTDDMTEAVYDKVEPMQPRSAGDAMDNAPPLFTGAMRLNPQGGHDREGQVIFTHDQPVAMTVLAIFARGDMGEAEG